MISPDLAVLIAKAALTEPFRQIKPMTTDKFRDWLWNLDIKFMDWQTLHYLWIHGVALPVAVTQRAIDHTPGVAPDRFIPVVRVDGEQVFGDLGLEDCELPALEFGREDFVGLEKSLWWHPLQLYQFQKIEWCIEQNWSLDSYLRNVDPEFSAWTNLDRNRHRELVASKVKDPKNDEFRKVLALLLNVEPCVHGYIHGSIRYDVNQSIDEYYQWRSKLLNENSIARSGLSMEEVEHWHRELSINASLRDPLESIRILVNQVDPKRRSKLKGIALQSDVLYSHAETLRRYLEWSQDQKILEEDDYGAFGSQSFKEDWFGSRRVFDGKRDVLRRINRYYGIDHAERVALLLEGPTEVAFFERVAAHWGIDLASRGIVLYDLGGKDKIGKDRILLQHLQVLQRHEIFAYAALDNDGGGNHLKSMTHAAKEGLLSAGFTIWEPDFESHNFSLEELAAAATRVSREHGIDVEFTAIEIQEVMADKELPAGKAMEQLASRKRAFAAKGSNWGEALADVVSAERVEIPDEIKNEDGERPVFSIFGMIIRAVKADYQLSLEYTKSQQG